MNILLFFIKWWFLLLIFWLFQLLLLLMMWRFACFFFIFIVVVVFCPRFTSLYILIIRDYHLSAFIVALCAKRDEKQRFKIKVLHGMCRSFFSTDTHTHIRSLVRSGFLLSLFMAGIRCVLKSSVSIYVTNVDILSLSLLSFILLYVVVAIFFFVHSDSFKSALVSPNGD